MDLQDPKQVEELEQEEKANKVVQDSTIEVVLSTYQGRLFVWQLLVNSGLFKEQFYIDSERVTSYLLGKAAFGKMLFAKLQTKAHIDKYRLMQNEAQTREEPETFSARLERE